jgi:dTDP-4-dehydrorhamnose reductase
MQYAADNDVKLIHISTAYLMGIRLCLKMKSLSTHIPSIRMVLQKSGRISFVSSQNPNAIILRTLMGLYSPFGNTFCKKQCKRLMRGQYQCINDQIIHLLMLLILAQAMLKQYPPNGSPGYTII